MVGLSWLDGRPSKARSPVTRLVELLRVGERLGAELRKYGDTAFGSLLNDPPYVVLVRQYQRTLEDINGILAGYVGTRHFSVGDGYPLRAGFMESRIKRLPDPIEWTRRDEFYWDETRLINYLLSLAERGSIDRLRTCRECHKWFYAMTDHQKNCSEACRQRFASHNPSFKEKRRQYMLSYRRQERERDRRVQQISKKAK
jgi:hypothetical protein